MDWVTVSALATAGGTLILALATFASVRSANRAARAAERSLLAGLRPVLMSSRLQDLPQKVSFFDQHWVTVEGGHAAFEVSEQAIYLVISLRNAGAGMAVLHGWQFHPERLAGTDHPAPKDFRRLTRDLYVPSGDIGFWQGAFRDPNEPIFATARDAAARRCTAAGACRIAAHRALRKTSGSTPGDPHRGRNVNRPSVTKHCPAPRHNDRDRLPAIQTEPFGKLRVNSGEG